MFNDKSVSENEISQNSDIIVPDSLFEKEIENTGDEKLKKISEFSKKGYQFIKENEYLKATEAFEEILKIEENNNYALVGLGDCARKQNHLQDAIMYYSKCLTIYPNNNYALFGLADCYKSENQFAKAITIWQKYLEHDDKNITVITRVADAYRKTHDFKRSKELYLRVLEIEPNNAYALIGLGHLNYDFKEYKDALYYWNKIYEINKDSVDIRVLTSIGNCYRKLKSFESGTRYFENALEREPKNFYALFGLADCYRGMNQQYKSIEYWNRILEADPNNKVILTRAGDAYRTTGNYESAKEYYQKALDIDFDVYAAIGMALICKGEGKYQEAIERFKKLILDDSKNSRLYNDLADCYIAVNDKASAIKILESYLQIDGKNSTIKNTLEKIR